MNESSQTWSDTCNTFQCSGSDAGGYLAQSLFQSMKDRQREVPLDDDGVGNVDKECPDHRHNQKRQMRMAEAACGRLHIGNCGRRRSETEPAMAGGQYNSVVVTAHYAEGHEDRVQR